MDTTAQLHGERAADLDDTHLGAVVLTEQGHRTHRLGLVEAGLDGVDLVVGVHRLIGDQLDPTQLVGGELLTVVEVETQVAGLVQRTCLDGGRAEHLTQGGVDHVRAGVRLAGLVPPGVVDGGGDPLADGELTTGDGDIVQPDLLTGLLHVIDRRRATGTGDLAAVGELSTGLGIEGGLVQDQLDLLPLAGPLDESAPGDDTEDRSLGLGAVVAEEDGRVVVDEGPVDGDVGMVVLLGTVVGLGAGLLLGHAGVEALLVHGQTGLGGHLDGEVDREAVGVVQRERGVATQLGQARALDLGGDSLEQTGAGLESLEEGGLLAHRDGADTLPVVGDLRVGRGHGGTHGVHELLHGHTGGAQQTGGTDDTAQQATQDVAAPLVARGDPVEDEHQAGTAVVGDDAETDVVGVRGVVLGRLGVAGLDELLTAAVGRTGEVLGDLDHRSEEVGLVDVLDTLEDAGDALDTHTGVDVLLGQRAHDLEVVLTDALAALILHEHEVPQLDVPGVVDDRSAVLPVLLATVVVDLRAGAARAGDAHRPVVVGHAEALDPLFGDTDLLVPDLGGLVVVEVDGDPKAVLVQSESALVDRVGEQRPGVADRAFLEVLAEGEVAGHLEEGVVAGGDAHFLDVEGAHTLLDGGGGAVGERRVLLAQEVGLEGHHAGVDEEQVRVVEDQRGAGHLCVTGLDVVVDESLTDLMRLHGVGNLLACLGALPGKSLPAAADYPTQGVKGGGDLTFPTMVGGVVVHGAGQVVGQIVLGEDAARVLVGVTVTDGVAEALRPRIVPVAQVRRNHGALAVADVRQGGVDGGDHRIRLRCGGEMDGGLRQRDASLRHADEADSLVGGHGNLQGGRVRHPNVLGGVDDEPTGDEPGVLPCVDHPRQVVQGGVRVGAADGLDEGADDVEVLVTVPVIACDSLVGGAGDDVDGDLSATLLDGLRGGLEVGQGASGIAGGQGGEPVAGLVGERDLPVVAARVLDRPTQQRGDVGRFQRLELDQQRAREQRGDDGETRVLGGRGDEQHRPVLHGGEQGVLLGLGEPVDLVDEEHGGDSVRESSTGVGDDRADLLDPGVQRGERFEPASGTTGDEGRHGRLPRAGRTVEDDGGFTTPVDETAQR